MIDDMMLNDEEECTGPFLFPSIKLPGKLNRSFVLIFYLHPSFICISFCRPKHGEVKEEDSQASPQPAKSVSTLTWHVRSSSF
jgi:hypothetical protein